MYVVWERFVLDYVNVLTMRLLCKTFCASMFGLCASDALQHLHLKNIYPLFALHILAFLKLPVLMSLTICEKPLPQINYIENIPSTSEWKYVYLNVYLQNAGGVLTYRTRLIHFCNDGWVAEKKDEKISSFLASIPGSKLNRLNLLLPLIALLLICFTIFYSG